MVRLVGSHLLMANGRLMRKPIRKMTKEPSMRVVKRPEWMIGICGDYIVEGAFAGGWSLYA